MLIGTSRFFKNLLKSFFTPGKTEGKSQSWYGNMNNSYNPFKIVSNTKDFVLRKVAKVLGAILFLYFLAKSIPKAFSNHKLKNNEAKHTDSNFEI